MTPARRKKESLAHRMGQAHGAAIQLVDLANATLTLTSTVQGFDVPVHGLIAAANALDAAARAMREETAKMREQLIGPAKVRVTATPGAARGDGPTGDAALGAGKAGDRG